jgi:hypothetical protein
MAGAGVTLLTEILMYPALGADVVKLAPTTSDEELRKAITTALLLGPSGLVLDNFNDLRSLVLAKLLTDRTWHDRLLGGNDQARVRVNCAMAATSINPDLSKELMRRQISCRIDPGMEHPWLGRTFRISNLRAWIRDNRSALIWAYLTIARAWHVAGRPEGDRELGMYESWSHVVGGILKYAGFEDFLAGLEQSYESLDIEGDAIAWFFEEWFGQHGTTGVRISKTMVWALASDSPLLSVITAAGREEAYGRWVRKLRDRVKTFNGDLYFFTRVKTNGRSSREMWGLVKKTPLI